MDGRARLVGRDADLKAIHGSLRLGRSVYLTGHAGVGKSRLLTELVVNGGLPGRSSESVIHVCGSEGSVASPLVPLLRLCPSQHPDPARAILAEIRRRSRDDTVCLLVDDAHTLDDASAALVRETAAWAEVAIVAAVRSGASTPPAISSLWREGLTIDHHLTPLDRCASDELVEDLIGRASAELRDHVWHRGRGHPLFVRELVAGAVEQGAMARRNGVWVLRRDPALPGRLNSLLRGRLGHLSPPDRRCLAVLALTGRVDRGLLGAVGLAAPVDSLVNSGLVVDDGVRLRAEEPLLAEVALAGLGSEERDHMRTGLADLLDTRAGGAAGAALLRLDAGQRLAAHTLVTALRQALADDLLTVAERIAASAGDGPHPPGVALLLMRTAAMGNRWPLAEHWWRAVLHGGDQHSRELAHAEWAEVNFEYRADPAEAVAQVTGALELPGLAPGIADRLQASMLRARMFTQDLAPMVADGERFLSEKHTPAAAAQVRRDVATARSHLGTLRQSQLLVEHELDAANPPMLERLRLRVVRIMTLTWTEGPAQALEAAASLLEETRRDEDPETEALALLHLAVVLHDAGRHGEAVDDVQTAEPLQHQMHRRRHRSLTAGVAASSLALLPDRAVELEALLAQHDPQTREHWIDAPLLMLARSRSDHAHGRSPWPGLEAGLEHARRRSSGLHELQLLREAAYRGRAQDVVERVAQLAVRADAVLADLVSEEVAGLAADDGTALQAISVRLAGVGATGLALDAVTAAAAAHTRAGRGDQTLRSEVLAAHLRRDLPGQCSIAEHAWVPVLSPREQEVVDLVVDGAPDREVADALFLSVRTVERHLHRVYSRTGISGRHELRRLVREDVAGLAGPGSNDPGWFSRARGTRRDV